MESDDHNLTAVLEGLSWVVVRQQAGWADGWSFTESDTGLVQEKCLITRYLGIVHSPLWGPPQWGHYRVCTGCLGTVPKVSLLASFTSTAVMAIAFKSASQLQRQGQDRLLASSRVPFLSKDPLGNHLCKVGSPASLFVSSCLWLPPLLWDLFYLLFLLLCMYIERVMVIINLLSNLFIFSNPFNF